MGAGGSARAGAGRRLINAAVKSTAINVLKAHTWQRSGQSYGAVQIARRRRHTTVGTSRRDGRALRQAEDVYWLLEAASCRERVWRGSTGSVSNPYRFQSVDPRNDTQVLYPDQHKGERDDNGVDKLHRVITYAYRIASHVCLAIRNLKQLIDVIAKKTDEEGGAGESATTIDLERGHVRHID